MLKDALILILVLAALFAAGAFLMMGGPEARRVLEWFRDATMEGSLALWVYATAALSLAALVATAVLRLRRGRSGAKRFALRHGLFYEPPKGWLSGHRGRVYGERSGRRVTLELQTETSVLELRVQVRGAPASLTVWRRLPVPGVVSAMETIAEKATKISREIRTGDPVFDQQFSVGAKDADGARAWLDADRRRILSELLSEERYGLGGGEIFRQELEMPRSPDPLTEILERLERAADALEG